MFSKRSIAGYPSFFDKIENLNEISMKNSLTNDRVVDVTSVVWLGSDQKGITSTYTFRLIIGRRELKVRIFEFRVQSHKLWVTMKTTPFYGQSFTLFSSEKWSSKKTLHPFIASSLIGDYKATFKFHFERIPFSFFQEFSSSIGERMPSSSRWQRPQKMLSNWKSQ